MKKYGKRFVHDESHYTGNHPSGYNTIYRNGEAELMRYIGAAGRMTAWELLGNLWDSEVSGVNSIVYGGYRIRIIKARTISQDNFHIRTEITYHVIKVG